MTLSLQIRGICLKTSNMLTPFKLFKYYIIFNLIWFCFMVFNTTFNNISVISWRSVLLVEKSIDLSQVTDKLYHIMLSRVHLTRAGFEPTTSVMIGTDYKGSYTSNCHMTTTTTAPILIWLARRHSMHFSYVCPFFFSKYFVIKFRSL